MARRKRVKPQWSRVELAANIGDRSDARPVYRASQAEMCEMFDVRTRTLRSWTTMGLPTEKGPGGAPVYTFPSANVWVMCYRSMMAEDRNGKGPRGLSVQDAHDWHLGRQMEEEPRDFVIVPLDWDHPAREQQLRRAAEGREPLESIEE
jgi:hypothetical protein